LILAVKQQAELLSTMHRGKSSQLSKSNIVGSKSRLRFALGVLSVEVDATEKRGTENLAGRIGGTRKRVGFHHRSKVGSPSERNTLGALVLLQPPSCSKQA
jgi:hypothetical protein